MEVTTCFVLAIALICARLTLVSSESSAHDESDLETATRPLKGNNERIGKSSSSPEMGKMVDNGIENSIEQENSDDKNKDIDLKPGNHDASENSSFLLIEKSLTNITKDSGETVKMRCEFRGQPTPEIAWFKNEAPLEIERGKVDIRRYNAGAGKVGSRLKLNHLDTHDSGFYKCESSNGDRTVETTGILIVKAGRMHSPSMIPNFPPPFPHFPALGGRLPEFEQDDIGFCQVYRGIACSQLIGNRTVYVKAKMTLNQMEENLAALFTILAAGKELSQECHRYAVPFFCFVLLAPCDDTVPYPIPRKVCRHDCETLESSTCKQEMMIARKHPFISQQNLLPACSDLPNPQETNINPLSKENHGSCISLNVPKVVMVDREQTCYVGQGETYRGPVSHTLSTHKCQPWSQLAEYEELSGNHNYCRNPGGLESQPWCFISDPHIRRELCDIPKCPDYSWLYIFLPSLTTFVLLILLFIIWCKKQRRKSSLAKLSPQGPSAHLIPTHHQTSQIIHSQQQQIEMQKFVPRIPVCIREVPPKSFRYIHELGDGVFGKVYRGELTCPSPNGSAMIQPVAIKTLRDGCSTQTQQEFCRELESVAQLQHPNVVCLVAICIREECFCMLFEYNFQCDLHEYLLVHSPHSDVSARSEDGTPQILELADFLIISIQIAAGMEYLSSKRYVHRDLAARNCLVCATSSVLPSSKNCLSADLNSLLANCDVIVKVSDLGISRNSCNSDYFRIRNTLLPVRWMAPESLLYGTFTTESDVWSFGVLLWEIFSYGIQPYFSYDNQDVIDLVCTHQLLPRPEYCPAYVYSIMNDCWHDTASHRPGFKEIYNRLCSVQTLHERAFSISHSVLTHNSSHPSSTGPSNKTLSTNLSGATTSTNTPNGNVALSGACLSLRPSQINGQAAMLPFCQPPNFNTAKMIPAHRTHQCEQV